MFVLPYILDIGNFGLWKFKQILINGYNCNNINQLHKLCNFLSVKLSSHGYSFLCHSVWFNSRSALLLLKPFMMFRRACTVYPTNLSGVFSNKMGQTRILLTVIIRKPVHDHFCLFPFPRVPCLPQPGIQVVMPALGSTIHYI